MRHDCQKEEKKRPYSIQNSGSTNIPDALPEGRTPGIYGKDYIRKTLLSSTGSFDVVEKPSRQIPFPGIRQKRYDRLSLVFRSFGIFQRSGERCP